jgi:hypothetical protein
MMLDMLVLRYVELHVLVLMMCSVAKGITELAVSANISTMELRAENLRCLSYFGGLRNRVSWTNVLVRFARVRHFSL